MAILSWLLEPVVIKDQPDRPFCEDRLDLMHLSGVIKRQDSGHAIDIQ
jgi:hypothetical protein